MCIPLSPLTGMQIPINDEGRDLAYDTQGTDAQLASLDGDRRSGMTVVANGEGHDFRGYKGTGAQRVSTVEGRDLGNTKGAGVQIAGATIQRK